MILSQYITSSSYPLERAYTSKLTAWLSINHSTHIHVFYWQSHNNNQDSKRNMSIRVFFFEKHVLTYTSNTSIKITHCWINHSILHIQLINYHIRIIFLTWACITQSCTRLTWSTRSRTELTSELWLSRVKLLQSCRVRQFQATSFNFFFYSSCTTI